MTVRAIRRRGIERWAGRARRRSPVAIDVQGQARPIKARARAGEPAQPARVAASGAKRALDLFVAALTLLFLAPLMLLVAAAIFLETGGPVLFRQRRTGYRGEVFTIFKFRTMTVAEEGAEARQAARGDHRVTKVGYVLRKLSVDELPQLLNVMRGEMSLVGPRPHAVGHDAQFARLAEGYDARFQAKPGLTGLAQVRGHRGEVRQAQCVINRVAADCEYIRTWSFGLDLKIMLRTIPLLFGDPRAY